MAISLSACHILAIKHNDVMTLYGGFSWQADSDAEHWHLISARLNKMLNIVPFGAATNDLLLSCKVNHLLLILWHTYKTFRSPMYSPHKGQCRGTLMFSLVCAWTSGWPNSQDAGNLRCHRAHFDIILTSLGLSFECGTNIHADIGASTMDIFLINDVLLVV